jgi:cytochrome c oxidase assembly protein subunit 11
MSGGTHLIDRKTERSNRLVAAVCIAFFGGMVGAAYASVPLYKLFCQVTGYGGTTQRVDQYSDRILDRTITVRFDTNTSGGIGWEFAPVERDMTMQIGETVDAKFRVTNLLDTPASGRATFNVVPELAGAYFNKVECFCFTDTTLKPGETLDMPVVFYVDPAIVDIPELRDIRTITLSYTYFPTAGEKPVAAAAKPAETGTGTNPTSKLRG